MSNTNIELVGIDNLKNYLENINIKLSNESVGGTLKCFNLDNILEIEFYYLKYEELLMLQEEKLLEIKTSIGDKNLSFEKINSSINYGHAGEIRLKIKSLLPETNKKFDKFSGIISKNSSYFGRDSYLYTSAKFEYLNLLRYYSSLLLKTNHKCKINSGEDFVHNFEIKKRNKKEKIIELNDYFLGRTYGFGASDCLHFSPAYLNDLSRNDSSGMVRIKFEFFENKPIHGYQIVGTSEGKIIYKSPNGYTFSVNVKDYNSLENELIENGLSLIDAPIVMGKSQYGNYFKPIFYSGKVSFIESNYEELSKIKLQIPEMAYLDFTGNTVYHERYIFNSYFIFGTNKFLITDIEEKKSYFVDIFEILNMNFLNSITGFNGYRKINKNENQIENILKSLKEKNIYIERVSFGKNFYTLGEEFQTNLAKILGPENRQFFS